MKVLIIQHQNFLGGAGGTEKMCCFIANSISNNGKEVVIVTNDKTKKNPVFNLSDKVNVVNIFDEKLNQKRILQVQKYQGVNPFLKFFYKRKKKLIKKINKVRVKRAGGERALYEYNLRERAELWNNYILSSKADLIITMSISSLLEITYLKNYKIPIINSTNGRPDYDYTDDLWYRSDYDMFNLRVSYKHLSGCQVLFESYAKFLPTTFNGVARVIPNPVPIMGQTDMVDHFQTKKRYRIIHIGSLVNSCKQQELAIKVFSEISDRFTSWDLCFWGEGNDYNSLTKQIRELKMENRIFLKGFTSEPIAELKKSDIFIFPSKYEGFPLALTEAMSVGLPCLGMLSCSGVNELIKHGENGFLAKNSVELKEQLVSLMRSPELREKMGKEGNLMMKEYSPEKIARQWSNFVEDVVK